jgi:hypothetical protein
MAKTLSDIRTRVRHHLNEATPVKWANATLNICINEAEIDVARLFDISFTTDATLDSVSGTQEYTLPVAFRSTLDRTGCLYTDSGSTQHQLLYMDEVELKETFSDLRTKTGTPAYYYVTNDNKVGFYPIPNYSGTNNIEMNGFIDGGSMSTDVTNTILPDTLFLCVVLRAAQKAMEWRNIPASPTITASVRSFEIAFNLECARIANKTIFPKAKGMSYFGY